MSMVEPIIFSAIGFLIACLMWLTFIPFVHKRAVRLTTRRVQAAAPSMTEIIIQKDHLRAEFAVAARRLEQAVEQMKATIASQRVELGVKSEMIVKLKNALGGKVAEVDTLKGLERVMKARARTAEEAVALRNTLPSAGSLIGPIPATVPVSAESDTLPEVAAPTIAPANDAAAAKPALSPASQAGNGRSPRDHTRALPRVPMLSHVVERTLGQISNTARSGAEVVGVLTSRFSLGGRGGVSATTSVMPPTIQPDSGRALSDRLRALHQIRALPDVLERALERLSSTARGGAEAVGNLTSRFGVGGGKRTDIGEQADSARAETATKAIGAPARPASPLERALQICNASNVFDQSTSETIQRSLGILGELKRSA
jgi:hypothetical protein